MSVSESLAILVHRASWLCIESRARALGFLAVAAIAALLAIKIEISPNWNLYASSEQQLDPSNGYHTFLRTAAELRSSRGELVLIVGGSTIRELTADDAFVSQMLTSRCTRDIRVATLGSS